MGPAAAVKLLAAGAIWRWTGLAAAGRALVDAFTAGTPTERILAGVLLVKAGDRSVPILTEAMLTGRSAADLVNVLASIESPAARTALDEVARAPTPGVAPQTAAAASEALRILGQIGHQNGARDR